jgi:hypothetical protein
MVRASFFSSAVLMLPLVIAAGCATPAVSEFTTIGTFSAMGAGSSPGKAKPGDILFTQKVAASEVARLTTGAEFRTSNNERERYVLNAGDLLFGGTEAGSSARVYCSFEPNLHATDAFGGASYQSCLSDEDRDGRFDSIGGFVGVIGPEVAVRAGQIVAKAPIPADIRYETGNFSEAPSTHIGVRFEAKLFRNPRLVVVPITRASEQANWHFKQMFAELPPPSALPATLNVGGAKIEILSTEASAINYRVVSGFPEGEQIKFVFDPLPFED